LPGRDDQDLSRFDRTGFSARAEPDDSAGVLMRGRGLLRRRRPNRTSRASGAGTRSAARATARRAIVFQSKPIETGAGEAEGADAVFCAERVGGAVDPGLR